MYRDSGTPHHIFTDCTHARDEQHIFPIVNCTECKLTGAPYSISVLNDGEYITHWWCLNCGYCVLERPEIKGWVSIQDLENAGWDSEL